MERFKERILRKEQDDSKKRKSAIKVNKQNDRELKIKWYEEKDREILKRKDVPHKVFVSEEAQ